MRPGPDGGCAAGARVDAGRWADRRGRDDERAHDSQRAAECLGGEAEEGRLPQEFEVRGETVMPQKAFEKMNKEREAEGLAPAVNPRNAAAGTLRTKEPSIVAQRRLDVYAYFLLTMGEYSRPWGRSDAGCADGAGIPGESAPRDGCTGWKR